MTEFNEEHKYTYMPASQPVKYKAFVSYAKRKREEKPFFGIYFIKSQQAAPLLDRHFKTEYWFCFRGYKTNANQNIIY